MVENGHLESPESPRRPDTASESPDEAPFRGLSDLDAEVLIDFVERQPTLRELAQKRGLGSPGSPGDKGGILAFLEWWNSPAVAAALDAMLRVQALRRELRNEELRAELVAILAQVAKTSTRPIEQRRAATTALGAMATPARRGEARRGYGWTERPRYARVVGANDPGPRRTQHPARSDSVSSSLRLSVSSRAKPRRIADFNLGPQDAERFLERERRENDHLEKLIQRVVATSDSIDEQQSGALHRTGPHQQAPTGGFKGGAASAVPTSQGTPAAEPPLSASQHQPANHADEEDALDFARRILRAVETNSPEAAHFTPEDIETARYYTSIFDQTPAPTVAEPRPP